MKLKTYNRAIDKFLNDLDYICQENAVQIIFTNKNYVKLNGLKSAGYFNDKKRILACALKTNNTEWLSTLVHESCHLDQWREKTELWSKYANHPLDEEDWLDNWIKGHKELYDDQLEEVIILTKTMEWECELKTVEKIKRYNLKTINLDIYFRQAILYIMAHDYVKKYRKWPVMPSLTENELSIKDYNINQVPKLTNKIEEILLKNDN